MVRKVLVTRQPQVPQHSLHLNLRCSKQRPMHQPLSQRKHRRPSLRLRALAMARIRSGKTSNQEHIAHVSVRLGATTRGSAASAAPSAISSRTTIPTIPRLSPLPPRIRASIRRDVVPGPRIYRKSPRAKRPLAMAYISSALT